MVSPSQPVLFRFAAIFYGKSPHSEGDSLFIVFVLSAGLQGTLRGLTIAMAEIRAPNIMKGKPVRCMAAIALLLGGTAAGAETVASLRVGTERSTFMAKVEYGAGYEIRFECVDRCRHPLVYREDVGLLPLGLFNRDDEAGLVYSLWGGGVGDWVFVWRVTDGGVKRVFQEMSHGRPNFLTDGQGNEVIEIFEGPNNQHVHPVRWTWRGNRFVHTAGRHVSHP